MDDLKADLRHAEEVIERLIQDIEEAYEVKIYIKTTVYGKIEVHAYV